MKVVHKFGRNKDVGNGAWEDVWGVGGTMPWPEVARTLKLHSASALDTSTGTGARSVTILGLSSAWAEQEETIVTAGTSTSAGSKKFVRVLRAYVETAGTYGGLLTGGNRGNITINGSTGATLATINISTGTGTMAFGQTQIAGYTVPAGYTGYVREISYAVNAQKPADIAFMQRRNADDVTAPMASPRLVQFNDGVDGHATVHEPASVPLGPFPPKTDLWVAAKGNGAATAVSANFEIALYPLGTEPEFG
jgi:hypothetical protein